MRTRRMYLYRAKPKSDTSTGRIVEVVVWVHYLLLIRLVTVDQEFPR